MLILPACVAAVVTGSLVPVVIARARARGLLDHPNERSSHRVPTPRLGGTAIVIGVFAGLAVARLNGLLPSAHGMPLAAGALAMAALSFVDDLRPLSAVLRLAGHVAIASMVMVAVGARSSGPLVDRLSVVTIVTGALWIAGLANAYNFMDGIDGLAAGQAIVAGVGWALVGVLNEAPAVIALALVVVGATAAFSWFNWQPARVFMGDTGSVFLGYTLAVMPFVQTPSPAMIGAAAMFVWPVLFDTGLTVIRRLARGENVVTAHRTHLYQRLVATGLHHSQVSVTYMALAALGWPSAIAAARGSWPVAFLFSALVAGAAGVLWRAVVRRERQRRTRAGDAPEPGPARTVRVGSGEPSIGDAACGR